MSTTFQVRRRSLVTSIWSNLQCLILRGRDVDWIKQNCCLQCKTRNPQVWIAVNDLFFCWKSGELTFPWGNSSDQKWLNNCNCRHDRTLFLYDCCLWERGRGGRQNLPAHNTWFNALLVKDRLLYSFNPMGRQEMSLDYLRNSCIHETKTMCDIHGGGCKHNSGLSVCFNPSHRFTQYFLDV